MCDIKDRLDRLESLVQQQQETIERQRRRIKDQRRLIEHQRDGDTQQDPTDAESRADTEKMRVSRRGAVKTAGLVGLLGAGAGAATAGPTIGEPGNQVETLYAESLDGSLTGGTAVTNLAGTGLTVSDGSLRPSLSADLTLSNGDIAVDVGPDDIGAAPSSHDNTAHIQEYAVDGTPQPPETHGNTRHAQDYAVDGTAQPPKAHGNEAHNSDFATSDEVPTGPGDIGAAPDNHGNEAHSSNFATSGEVPTGPGDIGAAPDNHGNEAHAETYLTQADVDIEPTPSVFDGVDETSNTVNIDESNGNAGIFAGRDNEIDATSFDGGTGVVILGGAENTIGGSFDRDTHTADTIVAGFKNEIQVDGLSGSNAVVAGFQNAISSDSGSSGEGDAGQSIIGAGSQNTIAGEPDGSAIVAGNSNTISISGGFNGKGFIGAGENNSVDSDSGYVITADGSEIGGCGAVVGGYRNSAEGPMAGVLNGSENTVAAAYATVPGGANNTVRGEFSLAVGNNATVEADGAVAFADASDEEFAPSGEGLHAQMDAYAPELHRVVADGNLDTDQLDPETALERLADLDTGASASEDGLRFDADAFNEIFNLDGDGAVGTLDVDTVLIAAVQALADRLDELQPDDDGQSRD